jgi:hypothetical protein
MPKSRRLREASLAQQLLLQTVEERRIKVQILTDQVKHLESELHDAHTQGKCVPHHDFHAGYTIQIFDAAQFLRYSNV